MLGGRGVWVASEKCQLLTGRGEIFVLKGHVLFHKSLFVIRDGGLTPWGGLCFITVKECRYIT